MRVIILLFFANCLLAQNKSKLFLIELNGEKDGYCSLPIKSKTFFIEFKLLEGDSVKLSLSEGKLSFKLDGDSLFFFFDGKKIDVKGHFKLNKTRHVRYRNLIDPESFKDVIRPEYYYVPIRTGIWEYRLKKKIEKVEYDIRYEEDPQYPY